jgi:hypothetical protein
VTVIAAKTTESAAATGRLPITCVLSGTATLEGNREVPVSGSAREKNVSFAFNTEHEGSTCQLVFAGVVGEDGGMTGSIAVAGVEGTFTAKKQ